jgi:hypothetical protein
VGPLASCGGLAGRASRPFGRVVVSHYRTYRTAIAAASTTGWRRRGLFLKKRNNILKERKEIKMKFLSSTTLFYAFAAFVSCKKDNLTANAFQLQQHVVQQKSSMGCRSNR